MTIVPRDENLPEENEDVKITFDQLNALSDQITISPKNFSDSARAITLNLAQIIDLFATDEEKLNIQEANSPGKQLFLRRRVAFKNNFNKIASNSELYLRRDIIADSRIIEDDPLALE